MRQEEAAEYITRLNLIRHPEGGWYRESYRSAEQLPAEGLPGRFGGHRSLSTAIYFLLVQGEISALHRIKSDELWHYYSGSAMIIHTIAPDGKYHPLHLGPDLAAGESFQLTVPAGFWFGAELNGEGFSLVGCTVAPGFDFTDFVMAERGRLLQEFPGHADLVRRMTR